MNSPSLDSLDQQELHKLAANASAAGDAAAALIFLKEAASRADANAVTHYVLGIEYAENGMFDKAIQAVEAAVALDPALAIARFQLGLLWMSSGDGPRAIEIFDVLAADHPGHYLSTFAGGLSHMARDEFPEALMALRTGMGMNRDNEPLNNDMQRMVDSMVLLQAQQPEANEADANMMFLSAYTGNTAH